MHYIKALTAITLFFLLGFSPLCGQETELSWQEEMEELRNETIQSLWQSERQPIEPEDTIYLNYYPIDSTYNINCVLVKSRNAEPFMMATYSGEEREYIKYGTAIMELGGRAFSVELYQNYAFLKEGKHTDYLFLPFKDPTNGEETYGGGRYLNLSISELEEDGCTINFNLAYNPWCAYSEGFHCPIPPKANHLDIPLRAGEKDFGKPLED